MSNPDWIYTFCGLIGDVCIVGSYFLLQLDRMQPHDRSYLYLNLVGTMGVTISLMDSWNLPAFVIEFFWAIITLYGLFRVYQRTIKKSRARHNSLQ